MNCSKKIWVIKNKLTLPQDIIHNILIFISHVQTLKNMKFVCKFCLATLKNHNFWKDKFHKNLPFFNFDEINSMYKNQSMSLAMDFGLTPDPFYVMSIKEKFEIYSNVSESHRLAHSLIKKLHYIKLSSISIKFFSEYDMTLACPIEELMIGRNNKHKLKIYGLVFRYLSRNFFMIEYNCKFLDTCPNCIVVCDFNKDEFILILSRLLYYFSENSFFLNGFNYKKYSELQIRGVKGLKKFLNSKKIKNLGE